MRFEGIHPTVVVEQGVVLGNQSLDVKGGKRTPQTGGIEIGEGTFVGANTTIGLGRTPSEPTVIGRNVKIGPQVLIAHGCTIGDDVIIHGGAHIAGFVKIGKGARIGMGACIRNRMTIGAGSMVGIGAVVVSDVPAGEIWVGNPAAKLRDMDAPEPPPSSYVI